MQEEFMNILNYTEIWLSIRKGVSLSVRICFNLSSALFQDVKPKTWENLARAEIHCRRLLINRIMKTARIFQTCGGLRLQSLHAEIILIVESLSFTSKASSLMQQKRQQQQQTLRKYWKSISTIYNQSNWLNKLKYWNDFREKAFSSSKRHLSLYPVCMQR